MGSIIEMWPVSRDGDGRGPRLWAALGVSLLCHALVLFGARGWRTESPPPPLVVTMIERGGGGDEGEAGTAAVAPAPAVAALEVKRAAPPRRAPSRRQAIAPAAIAPPATTTATLAPADAAAHAALVAATGSRAVTGDGSGVLGAGSGAGAAGAGHGDGDGGDGLRALCRSCPTPDYPGRARRQGWQGSVDVALAIGRDGAVQEARVGRSSGYPTLDEAALEVARRSHFAVPASGEGLRGQLRYRFVLDEPAARR